MPSYFKGHLAKITETYGSSVSGIYIRNPGNKGFTYDWYSEVFASFHASGMKIALEGRLKDTMLMLFIY